MSQDTYALKQAGAMERREFTQEVCKHLPVRRRAMIQQLLSARLPKAAPYLIRLGLVVLPSDRSWQGLYMPEAAPLMAAFIKWHDFDTRRSFHQVAAFFEQLHAGTGWYANLSKKEQQLLAHFVHPKGKLSLVRTA